MVSAVKNTKEMLNKASGRKVTLATGPLANGMKKGLLKKHVKSKISAVGGIKGARTGKEPERTVRRPEFLRFLLL